MASEQPLDPFLAEPVLCPVSALRADHRLPVTWVCRTSCGHLLLTCDECHTRMTQVDKPMPCPGHGDQYPLAELHWQHL